MEDTFWRLTVRPSTNKVFDPINKDGYI